VGNLLELLPVVQAACAEVASMDRAWPPDSLEMETLERDLWKAAPPGKAPNFHMEITVRDLVDLVTG